VGETPHLADAASSFLDLQLELKFLKNFQN